MCCVGELFKTALKLYFNIYVLQPDHVDHLDPVGISGSCDHRSGSGGRRHKRAVFRDVEENTCDEGGG